jgi:hypothetical protein
MLIVANALELGAAWVGAFNKDRIRDIFSIPQDIEPYALIPVGYAKYDLPEKIMQRIESQVYFNTYGQTIKKAHRVLREYNVDLKNIGESAEQVSGETAKFLKEKFEEFKKSFKNILNLK